MLNPRRNGHPDWKDLFGMPGVLVLGAAAVALIVLVLALVLIFSVAGPWL